MKQYKPILLPTEKFELTTDFHRYFVEEDALAHLTAELVFSIFRRYMCQAGCSMCYIQDQWIDDDVFTAEMIPTPTPQWEAGILRVFNMFDVVSTMDDLFMLNRDYPELLDFYRSHAHRMSLTSMTDVALFQQAPLLGPGGLLFKSIYEISLSDTFLFRGNGATAVKALELLKHLHAHTPISKIRFILCRADEDGAPIGAEHLQPIISWAKSNAVYIDTHDDITQGKNRRFNPTPGVEQEINHLQRADGSEIYQILRECVHMQSTELFLTINQATQRGTIPFVGPKLDGLTAAELVVKSLQHKQYTYRNYLNSIASTCERVTGAVAKYRDYFRFVSEAVTINPSYNFIPTGILKPYARITKSLLAEGFVATQYGWIRPQQDEAVISIFDITATSRVRLEHIPILSHRSTT